VMMYFIILLMDMLSNCLWMIAFHNCYYMQLFFSRIPVFSSARWPMKILDTLQYFYRLRADENVNIFSSAVLADENSVIFVGN
jgi:hypothetical protein